MTLTMGGRYILHEPLGTGGAGTVFRATDRLTATTVALKQVALPTELDGAGPATVAAYADALRLALANEFQTLASLHHPNIIGVLDYGFGQGAPSTPAARVNRQARQPYFTMEYLAGAQTILEAGAGRPVHARVGLLLQVLLALSYLHRRGILHRDIKPGNVLVTHLEGPGDPTVQVLDFGLSMNRGEATALAGTFAYMAPEVIAGQPVTEAADLYALGVIGYELLAGRHPFDLADVGRLIDSILTRTPDLDAVEAGPVLRSVIGRLLSKDPARRYPTAEACLSAFCQAIGQPPPRETIEIRESFLQAARFVGRAPELARLMGALSAALEGRGSAWLVRGESGVGKTRLLDELRTRALVVGALVVRAEAVREGGMAYQVWREPLRRLVLSTELTDLEAGILKPVVPDIEALLNRTIADVPLMEDQAGQQRLLNTIVRLFRREAGALVLILEDLQWAHESLDVLRQLIPFLAEQPLLIVGSYRDDEPEAAERLAAALPGTRVLKLERLSAKDVAELSASMLGEAGRQAPVVQLLQRESEGNTYFMVEIARALADQAGRLSEIGHGALPGTVFPLGVQTIVRRRLDCVPAQSRRLLHAAAVAGRQVDPVLLTALRPSVALDDWLSACATACVLELRDGRWQFVHDKLRDGLLAELDDAEQCGLHRHVALAIEQCYPGDAERAASLAYHWSRANDRERERHYTRLAGETAAARFANMDALDYLSRAIAMTPESDDAARYALLLTRERVYDRLGDRSSQAQDLAELARLAAALGDPLRQAEVAVRRANYGEAAADYPGMIVAAQDAIDLARAAGDVGIEAHGHLWWGRALWYLGDQEAARPHVEAALSLARTAGRRVVEADSLRTLALVCGAQGDFRGRRDFLEQALNLHQEAGDRRGEGIVFNNLGDLCRTLGDYAGARDYFQDALRVLHEIGSRWVENIALYNLGVTCTALGDCGTGRCYLQQSLELSREIGDRRFEAYALTGLGDALLGLGFPAAAADSFRQAIDIRRGLGQPHLIIEAMAGLARAVMVQAASPGAPPGELEELQDLVTEILHYLDQGGSLEGTEEPFSIYLTCIEALQELGDPRAVGVLDVATRKLSERAAAIPDEAQRRSFLANVPQHRAILRLARAGLVMRPPGVPAGPDQLDPGDERR
jgi:tetratricopeptide (TPR) repeat protein